MKKSITTSEITRRDLLRYGIMATAGLCATRYLPTLAQAQTSPALPKPKAKSVIQIWMWGGPAHLDTFDPKPEAGRDYCGPFTTPIETNISGTRICEMLPLLAKQADKYSIIRGMTHGNNAHETASYMVQAGHPSGDGIVHPCIGAIVSYFKGAGAGYKGLIPPYIVLTKPQGRFSEAGFLGPKYKPFSTGGDPAEKTFAVEGVVAQGVSEDRQKTRRDLLDHLDTLGHTLGEDPQIQLAKDSDIKAYELILGDAGKVFDLSQETDQMRDFYGRNKFGQSCLIARRLVEQGVPYVTINSEGWDTHKQHFQTMRNRLPQVDQGMSALLSDLGSRGLLDTTIVWWGGEFGRTPKVQWEAPWNGGRGHHGKVFSSVVAGGGFQGGHVIGASDDKGEEVRERPVLPADLIGSFYELLGIDALAQLPNPQGGTVPIMPQTAASGIRTPGILREIM